MVLALQREGELIGVIHIEPQQRGHMLGYWLGSAFPQVGDNIELAVVIIVIFSVVPIGIEVWRHRRKAKLDAALEEFNEEHPG